MEKLLSVLPNTGIFFLEDGNKGRITFFIFKFILRKNVQCVNLFIVDEVHLLGESESVLEVIISRMR
jgi:hypothetical protein